MRKIFILIGLFVHLSAFGHSFAFWKTQYADPLVLFGHFSLVSSAGEMSFLGKEEAADQSRIQRKLLIDIQIGRPSLLHPRALFLTNDQVITIDDGEREYPFWVPQDIYRQDLNFSLDPFQSGQPVYLISVCNQGVWRVELSGDKGYAVVEKPAEKLKLVQCGWKE